MQTINEQRAALDYAPIRSAQSWEEQVSDWQDLDNRVEEILAQRNKTPTIDWEEEGF